MKKFCMLLLLLFTQQAFSFELSSAHYQFIKGDESLCSSGPAKILRDDDEETFILGSIISIPLIKGKTQDKIADGQCTQVDELERTKTKLVFISTIQDCSKDSKHLEKKVIQSVVLNDNELIYRITSGKTSRDCLFKKGTK